MAEICEILDLAIDGVPPTEEQVESMFPNALVAGAFLVFTAGDPPANIPVEVKTAYDPASGQIEVCYDDETLPDGVTELAGSECPRDCWPDGDTFAVDTLAVGDGIDDFGNAYEDGDHLVELANGKKFCAKKTDPISSEEVDGSSWAPGTDPEDEITFENSSYTKVSDGNGGTITYFTDADGVTVPSGCCPGNLITIPAAADLDGNGTISKSEAQTWITNNITTWIVAETNFTAVDGFGEWDGEMQADGAVEEIDGSCYCPVVSSAEAVATDAIDTDTYDTLIETDHGRPAQDGDQICQDLLLPGSAAPEDCEILYKRAKKNWYPWFKPKLQSGKLFQTLNAGNILNAETLADGSVLIDMTLDWLNETHWPAQACLTDVLLHDDFTWRRLDTLAGSTRTGSRLTTTNGGAPVVWPSPDSAWPHQNHGQLVTNGAAAPQIFQDDQTPALSYPRPPLIVQAGDLLSHRWEFILTDRLGAGEDFYRLVALFGRQWLSWQNIDNSPK